MLECSIYSHNRGEYGVNYVWSVCKWSDIDTSPDKLGDVSCWPLYVLHKIKINILRIGISIHSWIFQAEDKWSHDASVSSSTEYGDRYGMFFKDLGSVGRRGNKETEESEL